jgi:hypothetical protein
MNTTLDTTLKTLTCAAAALAITAALSFSFVHSTAVVGARSSPAWMAKLTMDHARFGQAEPAVLVD